MTTGYVHSIETMGLFDGPGIRTVFFLQGCPLRCAYCHNPDSQKMAGGKKMEPEEILSLAKHYRTYYGTAGGVTFSGGEPLIQAKFLSEVLPMLKENGITTCVDTSGFGDRQYYAEVFPYIDTLLLDIKHYDEIRYQWLTGASLKAFERFFSDLDTFGFKGKIRIRHVMIPGVTDTEEAMRRLVDYVAPLCQSIERITILPYHTMGVEKYRQMGMPYRLEHVPPMDRDRALKLESYARELFNQKKCPDNTKPDRRKDMSRSA